MPSNSSLLTLNRKLAHLTRANRYSDALQFFTQSQSQSQSPKPDHYTISTLITATSNLTHITFGNQLHAYAIRTGLKAFLINGYGEIAVLYFSKMHKSSIRHDNYSLASVLSVLYRDFGFWEIDAYKVFGEADDDDDDAYKVRDGITFNVMIDGLARVGRDDDALVMFEEMRSVCLRPSELTFVSVFRSCKVARIAHQLHADAIKLGFEAHPAVSNAAINMYSCCGDLNAAHMVFQRLGNKDIVSWNSMISSFFQGNDGKLGILAYLEMQRAGIKPDEFTFGSLLAKSEFVDIVEMVQALICKNGLIAKSQVSNALVSAYCRHRKVNLAYRIFQDTECKNLVSWNTMISGFLINGFPVDGLEQFSRLLMTNILPNVYSLTIILSSCAAISALSQGKQVHGYIITSGFCPGTCLGNALITMYAKCGVLDWSLRVFDTMIERDAISYNALISAYAQHGQGEEAVRCFEVMQGLSRMFKPDQATFTAVLSACSHAGLVDDGIKIFNSMVNDYGLLAGVDHFSCIVDLLGRGGYLDEAEIITNSKHLKAHSNIWWALLSACAAHSNIKLGRIVAGILLETEKDNPSVYVLLANIYAAADQWQEAANTREMIRRTKMTKQPGCS
ncbi:hypothetical protein F8388_002542 [Cannabis sativa]|uniref:Pentatricopeptide repeat-containing protein n=1 Tax=Cannabis sativa TaxID=3483 RepID=A0A7J6FB48_CANSA|nr:hypothetical protein F8388_002542 [Cannabis sativa]